MASATPFLFSGSFKTASELRDYLVLHPGAVRALQTRIVWDNPEERNPLLQLASVDLSRLKEDKQKLIEMTKVLLLEFKVNPHARHSKEAYKELRLQKVRKVVAMRDSYEEWDDEQSTIDLRIVKSEDAANGSITTCNTALQEFAAHADFEKNQMLGGLSLMLDACVDIDERVTFFDPMFYNLGKITAMEVVYEIVWDPTGCIRKLIEDHAKKFPPKGVITSECGSQVQQRFVNGKLEPMLQTMEDTYRAKKADLRWQREQLQAKMAQLQAKDEELDLMYHFETAVILEQVQAATNLMAAIKIVPAKEEDADG